MPFNLFGVDRVQTVGGMV